MARKSFAGNTGTTIVLEHDSRILRDNPLGDPHVRRLAVWLPPGYDEGAGRGRGRRYPVLYDLVGFTGSGPAHLNWRPFDENVAERVSRLIAEKRMGPAIVVFPDCFTCLGGNQYINSSAIGRYRAGLVSTSRPEATAAGAMPEAVAALRILCVRRGGAQAQQKCCTDDRAHARIS